jgi:hypothetical protein
MAKSGSAFGGLGMAAIIGLRLFGAMSNSNAKPIQVSIGDCLSVSPTASTSKIKTGSLHDVSRCQQGHGTGDITELTTRRLGLLPSKLRTQRQRRELLRRNDSMTNGFRPTVSPAQGVAGK